MPGNIEDRKSFIVDIPAAVGDFLRIVKPPQSVLFHSGVVVLPQNRDVGWHNTENYEEIIVVLEGRGVAEAGDTGRRPIEKGNVLYIPPKIEHNIYNQSPEPLKYIYIASPAEQK